MKDNNIEIKPLRKSIQISGNVFLDNGGGLADNWHITQFNCNNESIPLDEIILNREELKKLYLEIGNILIR